MARKRISVIGAGTVGSAAAQRIALLELADVVLIDVDADLARGRALDILEAGPISGYGVHVSGGSSYEDSEGSDVVVIAVAAPNRSRSVEDNARIVKEVAGKVAVASPNAVLVVVSEPFEAMSHVALRTTGFPRERVLGLAGILDSARFRTFLSLELDVSPENVTAFVLGGHGAYMVPSTRFTTVAGVPVEKLVPAARLERIIARTREGGEEVARLSKAGSAQAAPAAAITQMVEAILLDKKLIVPCCVLTDGEYGLPAGSWTGLPVKLGARGVHQIVEFELSTAEREALAAAANHAKGLCDAAERAT